MALVLEDSMVDIPEAICTESACPDPWLIYVGAMIRRAREARGLTAQALGQAVHITQSHISHIEAGTARPSTAALFQLLRYLKIKPSEAFEPPIPAEHAGTIDLFARATPRAQALVRDMLLLFDRETRAAQQEQSASENQCA